MCECGHDRAEHGDISLVCQVTTWVSGGLRKCACMEFKEGR